MDEPQPAPPARRDGVRPRVGILTFHNTTNYGATLQTLGLMRAIARRGCDVEIIDYRPSVAAAYYRPRLGEADVIAKIGKTLRFRAFTRRHLTLSPQSCARAEDLPAVAAGRYDAVIVGSDQVWNVNDRIRPFDASYYLRFVREDGVKRLSYAASFGDAFPLEGVRDGIAEGLRHLDRISVRDAHSFGLVRELAARDATIVADPTLLDDLADLEVPPGVAGGFAVYYGTDAMGIGGAKANAWCRTRNLRVYSLGYRGPAAWRSRIAIGPAEWMGYLRAAAIIVTSTFHGAVFAAKMGRPFLVIARDWNAIKITDFASRIGLEHRVFRAESCPTTIAPELWQDDDVVRARPALDRLRAESDRFLDDALQFEPKAAAAR